MSDTRTVSAERWLPAERQHVAACNTLEHLYETGAEPVICDYDTGRPHYPAEYVVDARDWCLDCLWADLEPDEIALLPAAAVFRGVERTYQGGLEQFARDGIFPS